MRKSGAIAWIVIIVVRFARTAICGTKGAVRKISKSVDNE
jgi:hypothetical protein